MNRITLFTLLSITSITIFCDPKRGTKSSQIANKDKNIKMVESTRRIEAEREDRRESGKGPRSGNGKRTARDKARALCANITARK